jgi:hypothetical protein
VVPLPESVLVVERRLRNRGGIHPIGPPRPILSKVETVPQHLGSERTMGENEVVAALREHGGLIA